MVDPELNHDAIEAVFPLTRLQHGILLDLQLAQHDDVYLVQLIGELHGALDREAIKDAWNVVLHRHQALRCVFPQALRHRRLQTAMRAARLPIDDVDWRSLSADDQARQWNELLHADRQHGFPLARCPLMRLTLIHRSSLETHFLWTFHHLLLDGWSTHRVLREVMEVYEDLAAARPPRPSAAPSIESFVGWLDRSRATSPASIPPELLAAARAPATRLQIPGADRQRDPHVFQWHQLLSAADTDQVTSLVRRHGLAPSTLARAAWALLLARYSGSAEVLFGVTVSGRDPDFAQVESVVGLLCNTVPCQVQVGRNERVLSWLHELQAQQIDWLRLSHVPLALLRSGPLETIFAFENYPVDAALDRPRAGVSLQRVRICERTANPCTIVITPSRQYDIGWNYDPRRFDLDSIQRAGRDYRMLLLGLVRNEHGCLDEISLLDESEHQRIVVAWNATPRPYPRDTPIHRLFEVQAALRPRGVAVREGSSGMAYEELNRRSNQLARTLRSMGVRAESRVAVCLERGIDFIVSVLAILKAGACYVPIDPSHPSGRRAAMLDDSGATLLISHSTPDTGEGHDSIKRLHVDNIDSSNEPAGNLDQDVAACQLAYLIYTSGTTGKPKGIGIEHRSIARLVCNVDYVSLGPGDVVAFAANVGFDAATFEIWSALLSGGTVAVLNEADLLAPGRLDAILRAGQVRVMFLTSPLFRRIVAEKPAAFASLDTLLVGGDTLDPDSAARVFQHGKSRRLVHVYGPTESTTFATWHLVEHRPQPGERIPIGRPLSNTRLYLLDEAGRPVPQGIVGEIWLGGDGLARGYHGDPRLTAMQFSPDPFSPQSGARMYRSGDLGRYQNDGSIEFVGRRDRQIKLRGFRIELEEIEAVLASHPQIAQAAAVVRATCGEGSPLVVFYVPRESGQSAVSATELRNFLQEAVPQCMLPASFLAMESLPLTASGKVDFPRLHSLARHRSPTVRTQFHSALEQAIAEIWGQSLGIESVDPNEHFLHVGGNSLAAMEVVARIRAAFNVELSIRDLFESPTVRRLGRCVANRRSVNALPLDPIRPAVTQRQLAPLTYAQEGIWAQQRIAGDEPLFNVPLAFRVLGPLDASALRMALQWSLDSNAALRTRFVLVDGRPSQLVSETMDLPWLMLDLTSLEPSQAEHEVERWIEQETRHRFDLATGPLLRATLIALGPRDHVLTIVFHHLVMDGWSVELWQREVSQFYEALLAGQRIDPHRRPIEYTDFAVWQRDRLQGDHRARLIAYWRDKLHRLGPRLPSFSDDPPPASPSGSQGDCRRRRLDRELVADLREFSRVHDASLFMTSLAALDVLLLRATGQSDLVVGTIDSGRHCEETLTLIGSFADSLPIRVNLAGGPTFREVVGRVRQSVLEALDHAELPLIEMVRHAGTSHEADRNPFFDVLLSFRPPQSELQLSGLSVQSLAIAVDTARCDLELDMRVDDGAICIDANFRRQRFSAKSIDRLLEDLEAVLREATRHPDVPITESLSEKGSDRMAPILLLAHEPYALASGVETRLPSVSKPVANAIGSKFGLAGEGQTPFRIGSEFDGGMLEAFASQVRKRADATAITDGENSLTYRQLDQRASALAESLRSRGTGAESLVALATGRSVQLAVGLLGIWKASAAALLIDPHDPCERVRSILRDAGVRLGVSVGSGQLPGTGIVWIDLNQVVEPPLAGQSPRTPPRIHPDSLAYVAFTSGSTGRPRGVLVTHRNAAQHFRWMQSALPLEPGDRMLQHYSPAFDAMLVELLCPLMAGACVVLGSREAALDVDAFVDQLRADGITVLDTVPSLLGELIRDPRFTALLRSSRTASAPGLIRRVVCGGEAFPLPLWQRLRELSDAEIYNLYGPTEATITATCWRCSDEPPRDTVPIGRPITAARAYVLDENLQAVPSGEVGELYLAGPSIARGYLGQPGMTAASFLPDPHATENGSRMYRTGDLARFSADGVLVFCGRRDSQIQIRGHRIELAEIEAAIELHEQVERAAVVFDQESSASGMLVAYVVFRRQSSGTS
jgi:amino acid adenylation domain-containing protein